MKIRSKKESRHVSSKKSSKKQRKVIFKIFEHLQVKGELKNKYSIENYMDYIERNMKESGYSVTSEAIFKYYLAFLENSEQEQHRKRSKTPQSSSQEKRNKKSKKMSELEDEVGSSLRKFTIPQLNKQSHDGGEE